MDTVLVLVAASTKVMLVFSPKFVGRIISAVALSYMTEANEATTVPVIVVVLVLAPSLVSVTVLVNVPTFDPLILTHKRALEELLAMDRVFVNAVLLVDTCQFVESKRVTVILVVRLDAVTRNALLALVVP